jgi:hypothetical protein
VVVVVALAVGEVTLQHRLPPVVAMAVVVVVEYYRELGAHRHTLSYQGKLRD